MAPPKARLVGGNTYEPIRVAPPSWMEDAECQKANPLLFHRAPGRQGRKSEGMPLLDEVERQRIADAKTYCARCPVMAECLKFARETGDTWAIMGGLTPDERRRMERKEADAAARTQAAG